MKTLQHIGIVIVMILILFVSFIYVIPGLLSIFDKGIESIPMNKYYFSSVYQYNKILGVTGIVLYALVILCVIRLSKWATKLINNPQKHKR